MPKKDVGDIEQPKKSPEVTPRTILNINTDAIENFDTEKSMMELGFDHLEAG